MSTFEEQELDPTAVDGVAQALYDHWQRSNALETRPEWDSISVSLRKVFTDQATAVLLYQAAQ